MPELPEVESIARTLRPLVRGQRIRCVHVLHAIAVKPQSPALFASVAQGRRVKDVLRHGKFLFLELDRGVLEMHFMFDGHLVWFSNARELLARANQEKDGVHIDVALEFDGGVLGFADQRHFGRMHAWTSDADCKPLQRLGVDAQSPEFTADFLYSKLSASTRPLKEFLLDQTKIAGIGNIYSGESLWLAQ